MRCMETGASSPWRAERRRLLRAAPKVCLALLIVGCTSSGDPSPTSGSTQTSLNSGGCAQDAIAAATTFLRAVAAGDSDTIRRCYHQPEPLAPWLIEYLSSSPWLYDEAAQTDRGQPIPGPGQVQVIIPLPETPRTVMAPGSTIIQMSPQQSGIVITTTLEADGAYYVTAALPYMST